MTIEKELQTILEENDGLLRPADVVEYARNPQTALHSHFTWDDSAAAAQFRLWQARRVINVHVSVIKEDSEAVRTYVSLQSDRKLGNGYRPIVNVMTQEELRREYLQQALREAQAWRKKYNTLRELQPVFDAIDNAAQAPVKLPKQLSAAAD